MLIQKGDVIVLNNKHKIVCGDSTDINNYQYMGEKAVITLTSPPYNFSKHGDNKYVNEEDLSTDEYLNLSQSVLNNVLDNSDYVFWNVSEITNNKKSLAKFRLDNINHLVDTMVWIKNSQPAMVNRILNSDFEYVYIYHKNNENGRAIHCGEYFRGTISNVINLGRNTYNKYADIHKALMSIKVANFIIRNFSKENELVLDPFSGIGTTLISCEKNNRRYYGIELEPLYIEATIDRLQNEGLFKDVYIKRGDRIIEEQEVLKGITKFEKESTCDDKAIEQVKLW